MGFSLGVFDCLNFLFSLNVLIFFAWDLDLAYCDNLPPGPIRGSKVAFPSAFNPDCTSHIYCRFLGIYVCSVFHRYG